MNITDFKILRLSDRFYSDYPDPPYSEILQKKERAYNCLLLCTRSYYICIPYRTEIKHKYAYHFKSSRRSQLHKSGLDYTKTVILQNIDYIDTKPAVIDKDEFNETVRNINIIQAEVTDFIDAYVNHILNLKPIHHREFERRYKYSPLQYFHDELNITGYILSAASAEPDSNKDD